MTQSLEQKPEVPNPSLTSQSATTKASWQAPYYVRALALGIPAIFLGFQISGWFFAIAALQQGRVDFRQLYAAGYMVRSGSAPQLYDYAAQLSVQNQRVVARTAALPFDHLSCESLFFAPFSLLPFRTAYAAFLVFNLGVLALCIRILRRQTAILDGLYSWLSTVIVLVFLPTAVALMQGQDSILLLVCLVGSFCALENGREFLAGALLSLGLFKFQVVLPSALLFLLWKRWRFSAGFAAAGAAILGISWALIGTAGAKSYVRLLLSLSVGLSSTHDQSRLGTPPAFMPNLRGLIFGLFNNTLSSTWIHILILGLSAVILYACWVAGSRTNNTNRLLIAILASSLIGYHFLIHDMTILLLPILVLLNNSVTALPSGDLPRRRIARFATLLFSAPLLFCFVPGHFNLASLSVGALLYAVLRWARSAADAEPSWPLAASGD
jgi:hypothetical protein